MPVPKNMLKSTECVFSGDTPVRDVSPASVEVSEACGDAVTGTGLGGRCRLWHIDQELYRSAVGSSLCAHSQLNQWGNQSIHAHTQAALI